MWPQGALGPDSNASKACFVPAMLPHPMLGSLHPVITPHAALLSQPFLVQLQSFLSVPKLQIYHFICLSIFSFLGAFSERLPSLCLLLVTGHSSEWDPCRAVGSQILCFLRRTCLAVFISIAWWRGFLRDGNLGRRLTVCIPCKLHFESPCP